MEELALENLSWFNQRKKSVHELLDKPLLINFWRPACRDCIEVTQFTNLLHNTYSNKGLFVVGICVPRFQFEKESDYLRAAVRTLQIEYPVALDNTGTACKSFDVKCCPSNYLYLNGRLLYEHIGSGGYYELETAVRDLLSKAKMLSQSSAKLNEFSLRLIKDFIDSFNQGRLNVTTSIFFNTLSHPLPKNVWLQGFSESDREKFCAKTGSQAVLKVKYKGRCVDAVLSNHSNRAAVIEVLLDGTWIKSHMLGGDVAKHPNDGSYVIVKRPGLYRLIDGGWGRHELLLRSSDGFCVYAVNFC